MEHRKIANKIEEKSIFLAKFICSHFCFIITLIFITSITEVVYKLLNCNFKNIIKIIMYIFSEFFMSITIVYLIERIQSVFIKGLMKILLFFIIGIMSAVEFFTLYYYHVLIRPALINVILESNMREIGEFLGMYIGNTGFITGIFLCLIFLYIICKVDIPYSFILKNKKSLFLIFCIGAVLSIRLFCLGEAKKVFLVPRYYFSIVDSIKTMNEYNELYKEVKRNILLEKNQSKIENVVFIVGESINRNHMGIYGYNLDTTPHLKSLVKRKQICVFQDVISPHCHTSPALGKIFTFAHHEEAIPWYRTGNLISILNAAGYTTCWISNQESSGIWGSVAQVFSDLSKEKKFTHYRDSKEDEPFYDAELIPLLDQQIAQKGKKNFYVIHLMGAHSAYKNRYPAEYDIFHRDDIKSSFSGKKKDIIATYDNAILYNDTIVKEIIYRFREKEAIVIYISDHGEEVYDQRDFVGHDETQGSRYMVEIPMIVWASDSFKERYPKKWDAICSSVKNPYMTDDMIHSFLDLLDIETIEYEASRSIWNKNFNSERERIYNNKDYDIERQQILSK